MLEINSHILVTKPNQGRFPSTNLHLDHFRTQATSPRQPGKNQNPRKMVPQREKTTTTNRFLVKEIKIEIRRRLRACQVYIILESSVTGTYSLEEHFKIRITDNKLYINSSEISLPLPYQLIPDSLCGLTYKDNILTFRVQLNEKLNEPSSSSGLRLCPPLNMADPLSQFETGTSTALQCLQCGSNILNSAIRITHAYSTSMNAFEASDMFCHRDKNTALEFEKDTSSESCGYSVNYEHGCFTIPQFNAASLKKESKNVIYCNRCYSWLGVIASAKECSMKFWIDTVRFSTSKNLPLQEQISMYVFYTIIEKTVSNCLFPICNIVLVSRISEDKESKILLTVMDMNVPVFEYKCEEKLFNFTERAYLKVLFRQFDLTENENEINIHRVIHVSKPTFYYALRTLQLSANKMPLFNTEEKVAYVRIL